MYIGVVFVLSRSYTYLMTWQDIILSVGSWIFAIALIPSILSKDKPALSSSLITGSVLTIFACTYLTLSLWTTAASTVLVAGMWFTLALQKIRLTRREKLRASASSEITR